MIEATTLPCDAHPDGGTHHLVPRTAGTRNEGGPVRVMRCQYCGATEAKLRHDAEARASRRGICKVCGGPITTINAISGRGDEGEQHWTHLNHEDWENDPHNAVKED